MANLIRLGTFNLNNLFSRWNFKEEVTEDDGPRKLVKEGGSWVRRFQGKLIEEKPAPATARIAERILVQAPDVLAVQEVEDRPTLDDFNARQLGRAYPYRALVEGNDDRFIDVGVLSKLPLGEIRSHQTMVHPEIPDEPVFQRDLLQVELLSKERKHLLWLFVAHLKSKFVDWTLKDPEDRRAALEAALGARRREAESIAEVLRRLPGSARFFVCGDFNDTPGSAAFASLLGGAQGGLGLVNVLAKLEPDAEKRWTASHKETGADRLKEQIDFVLASPKHADHVARAWVDRRKTGVSVPDGSDHDGVYCDVEA